MCAVSGRLFMPLSTDCLGKTTCRGLPADGLVFVEITGKTGGECASVRKLPIRSAR